MATVGSEERICLISDDETTEQRIGFLSGDLVDRAPECRERIATAVLAALVTARGKYSTAMPKVAVDVADDLLVVLSRTRGVRSS